MTLQHKLPNQITEKFSKKNAVYFQPEDNHETRITKKQKVLQNYTFKHELKITFLFNFYAKQRRLRS